MTYRFLGVLVSILLFAAMVDTGCSTPASNTAGNSTPANSSTTNQVSPVTNQPSASNENPDDAAGKSTDGNVTTGNAVAKAACMVTNVGGKRAVHKGQTFAIDFEPFTDSCFVTSYNPEYGDIHMESQFDIY